MLNNTGLGLGMNRGIGGGLGLGGNNTGTGLGNTGLSLGGNNTGTGLNIGNNTGGMGIGGNNTGLGGNIGTGGLGIGTNNNNTGLGINTNLGGNNIGGGLGLGMGNNNMNNNMGLGGGMGIGNSGLSLNRNPTIFSNNNSNTNNMLTGNNLSFGQNLNSNSNNNVNYSNNSQNTYQTTLSSDNRLKYEKISNLEIDKTFKDAIVVIEEKIKKNDVVLKENETIIEELDSFKRKLISECSSLLDLYKNYLNSQKNTQMWIENLNDELKTNVNELLKVKKNISLLENNSSVKIPYPSDYYEQTIKEMKSKLDSSYQKLIELESLIYYDDESYQMDKEQKIQETIMTAYNYLIECKCQDDKLKELLKGIKSNYIEHMKSVGMSEKEIEDRIKSYIDSKKSHNNIL